MKAIELVQKALSFGNRLSDARQRGLLRGDQIFVRVVHVTTAITRKIASAPPRTRPTGTERTALAIAAAQLRHLGHTLAPDGQIDAKTPEGALAGLVVETLALVDALLDAEPELAQRAPRATIALPSGEPPPND